MPFVAVIVTAAQFVSPLADVAGAAPVPPTLTDHPVGNPALKSAVYMVVTVGSAAVALLVIG
jgi:hypothetical protein